MKTAPPAEADGAAGVSGTSETFGNASALASASLRPAVSPTRPLFSPDLASSAVLSPLNRSTVLLYHSTGLMASGTDEQPVSSATETRAAPPSIRDLKRVSVMASVNSRRCPGPFDPRLIALIRR